MKKHTVVIIAVVYLIIVTVSSYVYRNYQEQQRINEISEANKALYLKVSKRMKAAKDKAQLAAEKAKNDALFSIQKKEREAKMKQLQENINTLEIEKQKSQ